MFCLNIGRTLLSEGYLEISTGIKPIREEPFALKGMLVRNQPLERTGKDIWSIGIDSFSFALLKSISLGSFEPYSAASARPFPQI